ncbi:neither inactivation nor afterpotential protein C-like [Sitophilus oryzae]|uniref:Neither inactivation nor afterpotential protein C-like n=1 Tax=Sitophilus oryzae TaxID=7048 RepID=A0A6J2YDD9_SITOR|nr:neither inactivation nor afterpotential protein C-like [Sitophilus oryzae]
MFYVLLQYRGAKLRDFYNFSQQVHLYNQNAFYQCRKIQDPVDLKTIDNKAQESTWFSDSKPTVVKISFRLDEIPFFDTSSMCDPLTNIRGNSETESWDSPYKWRTEKSGQTNINSESNKNNDDKLTSLPYVRDPGKSLAVMDKEPCNDSDTDQGIYSKNFKTQKQNVSAGKTNEKFRVDENGFAKNSTPANKEFEYIKSVPVGSG